MVFVYPASRSFWLFGNRWGGSDLWGYFASFTRKIPPYLPLATEIPASQVLGGEKLDRKTQKMMTPRVKRGGLLVDEEGSWLNEVQLGNCRKGGQAW